MDTDSINDQEDHQERLAGSPSERAMSKIDGSPVVHVTSSWQRAMRQPSAVRTTVFV